MTDHGPTGRQGLRACRPVAELRVEPCGLSGQVVAFGDGRGRAGGIGVEPRRGHGIAVPLVQVRRDRGVPWQRGVELGQGGQAAPRAVGLTDRDGAVEACDRGVGEADQLVVPLDDLYPVGLLDTSGRRRGVRRWRPAPGYSPSRSRASGGLQDVDALGDQRRRPSEVGPGRPAAPSRPSGRSVPDAGRGGAASVRAGRRPPRAGSWQPPGG